MGWHRSGMLAAAAVLAVLPCTSAAEPFAARTLTPDVEVERLGDPVIEPANNYSENTRVRVRVVYPPDHPYAGRRYVGHAGPIVIEEWNAQVYDGHDGATRLPLEVRAPNGEIDVVLKSVARYAHFDMRDMPIPQIAVHIGGRMQRLQVPQWVDADGNDKTDWLEHRVNDLLAQMRASSEPAVARAAATLRGWEQSYKRDCGGFDERRPGWITIAAACQDFDGADSHRVNRGMELAATVLHELWHAYSNARTASLVATRRWPKAAPLVAEPIPCPNGCTGPVWLADPRYLAEEEDAEAFAERYKHLFP